MASEIELSAEFFADLKDHALPLDPRALRALQHNARALDLYTWLAHRLPRVRSRGGDFVSWAALHGQFGGDVSDRRTFRRQFKTLCANPARLIPSPSSRTSKADCAYIGRRRQ
jgi:hypothetical protein